MSQINSLNDPRLPERFWKKIDASQSDCWLWTGALKQAVQQYGFYRHEGKTQIAHRVAYKTLIGPVPDGLVLDHTCHTPRCVNPAHLQPVTQKENLENRSGPDRDSTSGIRGVYWHKQKQCWTAQVIHHGKTHHGGRFDSKERAAEVALAMRNRLFTNNLTDPREAA